jgi:hypothetical protein
VRARRVVQMDGLYRKEVLEEVDKDLAALPLPRNG